MRGTTLVGILLIAVAAIAFAFGGITYTRDEKKADIGPFNVSVEERERIPLPPIVGAVALVGGVALLIAGARKTS